MDCPVEKQLKMFLASAVGMTSESYLRLLSVYGTAAEVFRHADQPDFISMRLKSRIGKMKSRDDFRAFIHKLDTENAAALTVDDPLYPPGLAVIEDPPPVLYVLGNVKAADGGLAVVGSRKCTSYGRNMSSVLAAAAAEAGVTIVSGLARGVDTAAHTAALDSGGLTVAVLGSGADVVYPPENKGLYFRILDSGGAVVSPYPMGAPPLAANFPRRNRVITAISDRVLIIEAGEKSGALTTAGYALRQGKELIAVPGNADNPLAAGTNRLIHEGAAMVCEPAQLLKLFGLKSSREQQRETVLLEGDELIIAEMLREGDLSLDELAQNSGILPHKLATLLTMMELRDIVTAVPGGFTLNRKKLFR